mmetsp:Transcript_113451/g.197014  ORF Transcript_113451/g.197014 Transcript_113451/m.197014 type:complete len:524 (-) Transcript_113451:846-2417(-)
MGIPVHLGVIFLIGMLLVPSIKATAYGDVFALSGNNFIQTTALGKWIVMFYCPRCHHCTQLFEPLGKLSTMTFGEVPVDADDPVTERTKIGILDCTQSPNICQFQKVESYPQFRWKTTPGITWHKLHGQADHTTAVKQLLQRLARPELYIQEMNGQRQLNAFVDRDLSATKLVLMLPSPNSPAEEGTVKSAPGDEEAPSTLRDTSLSEEDITRLFTQCYQRGAGFPSLYFAVTRNKAVLKSFTKQSQAAKMVLFKDGSPLVYEGPWVIGNMSTWMEANRLPLVGNLHETLHDIQQSKTEKQLVVLAYNSKKEQNSGLRVPPSESWHKALHQAASDLALQERFIFGMLDTKHAMMREWVSDKLDTRADKAAGRTTLPTILVYDIENGWFYRNDSTIDQLRVRFSRGESPHHLMRRFLYRVVDGEEPRHTIGISGKLQLITAAVIKWPLWGQILGAIGFFLVTFVLPILLMLKFFIDADGVAGDMTEDIANSDSSKDIDGHPQESSESSAAEAKDGKRGKGAKEE